ncbi:MAG TPA: Flp1 family type IVb pilin [Acetivibrio clariflavus]|nr:Flp1 family type IVb pilin [Acetivibrio clariflavus]
MFGLMKNFVLEEDGMSTVEVVLIIAVLVGLAILFRNYITDFVKYLLGIVFNKEKAGTDPYDQTTPTPYKK